jgi:hypothetical protein
MEAKKKLVSAVAAAVLLSSDPKEPLIIEDLDSPDFVEVSDTLAAPSLSMKSELQKEITL